MNFQNLFLFKFIFILSFLFVTTPNVVKAQSVESKLSELADDAMSDWGRSWYYDKYIRGSATITSYRTTSSGDILGSGYFRFSRYGAKLTASMTIEISKNGYVTEVCYTDPSTNQADCHNP